MKRNEIIGSSTQVQEEWNMDVMTSMEVREELIEIKKVLIALAEIEHLTSENQARIRLFQNQIHEYDEYIKRWLDGMYS